jgi:hypothetical protein
MKKVLALLFCLLPATAFAADSAGKMPVKTNSKTDVQVQITDQAGSTLLNVQGNNTVVGAGGSAMVLPALVNTGTPSLTNGNAAALTVDGSGNLLVKLSAAGTTATNITQVNGVALSATNPLFTQLTDGTAVYVGAKAGQLPTTIGQTTKASSLSVTLASDQGSLAVSQGAPTGATSNRATPVNIAAAGSSVITCKGTLSTTTPVKLYQAHITSQSAVRCTLQYNNNASVTTFGDAMTSVGSPTATFSCPAGFCAVTSGASGTQALEANCTNLDTVANDVVCDVQYCNAASGC